MYDTAVDHSKSRFCQQTMVHSQHSRSRNSNRASDLARLQSDGCLIVVTHINNLKVDLGQSAQLGDRLRVRSTCEARKFKFTFRQEVLLPFSSRPLAQAQVCTSPSPRFAFSLCRGLIAVTKLKMLSCIACRSPASVSTLRPRNQSRRPRGFCKASVFCLCSK